MAAYNGRNAEESRFAQEDRELGPDRIISYHLPGQELATLVGLFLWNLRLVRGFELERPPHERTLLPIRRPQIEDRILKNWPRDTVLRGILADLDWDVLVAQRPGWHWDAAAGELHCEDGRVLTLTSVRPAEHVKGRMGITLRRPKGGREDCSARPRCLRSEREQANKHAEFSIPTQVADDLRQRLGLVLGTRHRPRTIEPIRGRPGRSAVTDALFLPATARHILFDAFHVATLRVHVRMPPPDEQRPRVVAIDVADRPRRRKTWDQNVDRYKAPAGTEVRVEVAGRLTLRQMLGERRRGPAAAGRAS